MCLGSTEPEQKRLRYVTIIMYQDFDPKFSGTYIDRKKKFTTVVVLWYTRSEYLTT